jgi:hypothetical protein
MERLSAASPNLIFLCILFFICLGYSNTLYSPLVLDDLATFIENSKVYVESFSIESFKQLSSTEFGLTRFIPILTFAVDHLIIL